MTKEETTATIDGKEPKIEVSDDSAATKGKAPLDGALEGLKNIDLKEGMAKTADMVNEAKKYIPNPKSLLKGVGWTLGVIVFFGFGTPLFFILIQNMKDSAQVNRAKKLNSIKVIEAQADGQAEQVRARGKIEAAKMEIEANNLLREEKKKQAREEREEEQKKNN